MSESRRRSEGSQQPWKPQELGIDPREAAAFRRRLDHQASAELIPLAGPDAAADQGPAIKAVWEPEPPGASGHGSRKRDHRGAGTPGGPARRARRRRRHSLIIGGVMAVAIGVTGYTELSGNGGPTFAKGAATTILPAVSGSADGTGQSANASLGTGISLTKGPSKSPSPSRSASPTPSRTGTKPAGGGSSPPSPPTPTSSGSAGGPGGPPTPSQSPSATPSQHQTTCFLIFCSG